MPTSILQIAQWFYIKSTNKKKYLDPDKLCEIQVVKCWTIQTVSNYKDDILKHFENLQSGSLKSYSSETLALVAQFVNWHKSSTFFFWLKIYSKILAPTDILFNQLHIMQINHLALYTTTEIFEKSVTEIRNMLHVQYSKGVNCSDHKNVYYTLKEATPE